MQIRSAMESSTSDYDKDKLQERLAKLSGGVAVLKVSYSSKMRICQILSLWVNVNKPWNILQQFNCCP